MFPSAFCSPYNLLNLTVPEVVSWKSLSFLPVYHHVGVCPSNKTLFCCANKQRNLSWQFTEPTNALNFKLFTNFNHSLNHGSEVLWNYGIINPFLWLNENLNSLLLGVNFCGDQHINSYGGVSPR